MPEITRFYDPTRQRRTKIELRGTHTWVQTVETILNQWINPSFVGRAVLDDIYASPAHAKLLIRESNLESAAQVTGDSSNAHYRGSNLAPFGEGTGIGASTMLLFDIACKLPSKWCSGKCTNPRFNIPRHVLLHEMVHCMRQLRGRWRIGNTVMNGKAMPLEEAIAIVVANMFMSEKGDNVLRAHHTGIATMPNDPQAFAADPRVRELADGIIEAQRREIDEMETLIADLERNPPTGD